MSRPIRLIFLLAGGVLLGILLMRVDVAAVRGSLRGADGWGMATAITFLAANVLIKAARWRWMVRRLTGHVLDLPSAVQAVLAGVAAASFSPARSVDLAKPLLLKQRFDVSLSTTTGAVLVERSLDGVSLVMLLIAALPLLRVARGAAFHPVLVVAGVLLAAGVTVLASPRMLRAVSGRLIERLPLPEGLRNGSARLADAFADNLTLWRARANFWPLLGWSLAAALCEAARLAAVFGALGLPLGLAGGMLTVSVANLVAVAALIPGGIGVTELSMAAVAGLVLGLPATTAGIAGGVLLDRVLAYYLIVAGGALVLLAAARPGRSVHSPSRG